MIQRPVVINVEMPKANAEYSQRLPKDTRKFTLQCRDGTAFRFAFESGHVAQSQDPFYSVLANGSYTVDNILVLPREEIFVACSSAGKIIELICWCDSQ
jgi:hypothetical protein